MLKQTLLVTIQLERRGLRQTEWKGWNSDKTIRNGIVDAENSTIRGWESWLPVTKTAFGLFEIIHFCGAPSTETHDAREIVIYDAVGDRWGSIHPIISFAATQLWRRTLTISSIAWTVKEVFNSVMQGHQCLTSKMFAKLVDTTIEDSFVPG